jgi:peptide/nickel transport system permease protein
MEIRSELLARKTQWGLMQTHFRRFKRSKTGLFGLGVILLLILAALLAEILAPFPPSEMHPQDQLLPPSSKYLLGTDLLGRDILSRILFGTRIAFSIAFTSIGLAAMIGVILGVISGYYGGALDHIIMGIMDVMFAFPIFLLAIVIIIIFGTGANAVIVAIAVAYIPGFVRMMRGTVMSVKQNEYIEAVRALGFRNFRIIVYHIIPNSMAPVIIMFSMLIGVAIILEAALSFLGMGMKPPTPSWGFDLQAGMTLLEVAPWVVIFPGLAIMFTVLGFNLLGDGMRDTLDPRLKL